jgi:small subunit ribosomal protein S11
MSEDNVKKEVSKKTSVKLEEEDKTQTEKVTPKKEVASVPTVGKTVGKVKKTDVEEETPVVKKKRRKVRRQVRKGRAYIKSSYNNTLVMFTDMHGNSLAWSSAGLLGFKGAKKATTYAANQVAMDAHEKVQKYGLKDIEVFVKGVGSGRDAALRALAQKGYNLIGIKDKTPVPHNGCRPKKPRRV